MTQKRNLSTKKIIEAAKEIINKEGAEKLSFSKVAGVLGVHSQAMYPYFADKEELKIAVINDFLDSLTEQIKEELQGISGKEALRIYGRKLHELLLIQPRLTRLAFGGIDYSQKEEARNHFKDLVELLESLIELFAKNDVDVINRARLYRAVIFGYAQNELWGLFKLALVPAQTSFEFTLEEAIATITA